MPAKKKPSAASSVEEEVKPKRKAKAKADSKRPAVSLSRLRANPRRGGRGR